MLVVVNFPVVAGPEEPLPMYIHRKDAPSVVVTFPTPSAIVAVKADAGIVVPDTPAVYGRNWAPLYTIPTPDKL